MMVVVVKEKIITSEATPQPPLTVLSFFFPSDSPKSQPQVDIPVSYHKAGDNTRTKGKNEGMGRGKSRMKITTKKVLVVVFFILSVVSLVRFLTITNGTPSSFSSPSMFWTRTNTSASSEIPHSLTRQNITSSSANLTDKEFQFLTSTISTRIPCNLLVFGLSIQYLLLSSLNAGGTTIFLDDNPEKLGPIRTNYTRTRIYKVEHHAASRNAYKLLKHARAHPGCAPDQAGSLRLSSCKLALTQLPNEIYTLKWDVILVDGPSGDRFDAPGRMPAIYTAAMIARAGNVTDVLVHDIDRIIEMWFTREFLCEENLISSKGKLWHLRIRGNPNSPSFCSSAKVQII
ncbi:Glucuronoxylan 4-o-methyltransferase [Thalictrum thalictroides]|uniref:Glucuronoxylan 4-o-methyltransferase n=1 Tax=Thalictrum thalictroides TaxID=46969 RepID=A0A7J6VK62_THATH|nr:Glucuronoxylan 4-o-methyltransferase [Thalictrum thalictroides]